jgi:hypothetical protein
MHQRIARGRFANTTLKLTVGSGSIRNEVTWVQPNYNRTATLARGEMFKWAAYDDICAQLRPAE